MTEKIDTQGMSTDFVDDDFRVPRQISMKEIQMVT